MSELVKINSLPIQNMGDIATAGQLIAQSGMLGAESPAAGFMIMATCQQEGMSLLEFGRRYHVDNRGKVTMRSDRMLAEFMERGGKCKWITKLNDTTRQAALFTYDVNVDLEVEFTIEEAKSAGYIKKGSNWEKDPAAQMRARVITRGVRAVCPAAVAGIYTPDELQDVYDSQQDAATPPVSPVQQPEQSGDIPVVNYNVCPVQNCAFTGKDWSELDTESLKQALTLGNKGVTQGHINVINQILQERDSE